MPTVDTEIVIKGVSRDTLWQTIVDFESYPSAMRDVLHVAWDHRDELGGISTWRVLLNGSELSWTESDTFTELEKVDFCLLEGDIEVWQGYWRIDGKHPDLTTRLFVEFDIGIPSLASVLHPVGARAIRANCRQMLAGVRETCHRREAALR